MNLIFIAALVAVCGAAKLDRTYLPPASAKTAGGSAGSLQTPFAANSLSDSPSGLPKGSFTNDFQGVVVDAATAGTRASGEGETGLGAPRISYGSTDSRVGDAAFRGTAAGFRMPFSGAQNFDTHSGQNFDGQTAQSFDEQSGQNFDAQGAQNFGGQSQGPQSADGQTASTLQASQSSAQGFNQLNRGANAQASAQFNQANRGPSRFDSKPERAQAAFDRTASTLRFENEVGPESYHYAFETDNGISAEENGVATNGVQAQGGFSYTGDDGQVYTVTYTADEGGYQPRGDHLPTPPPIPEEILKSLAKNAQDEAAGLIDDGSYDAQRYNAGSDYAESVGANVEHKDRQTPKFGKRPETDATASGTFINQNNQPFVGQQGQEDGSSEPQDDLSNGFGPSTTANTFGQAAQSSRNPAANAFEPSSTANGFGQTSQPGRGPTNGAFGPSNNIAQAAQPSSVSSSNGFGSRKEYLPPVSGFNQNRRPQGPSSNNAQFNRMPQGSPSLSNGQYQNNQGSQSSPSFGRPSTDRLEVLAQSSSTENIEGNNDFASSSNANKFSQDESSRIPSQSFGLRNEYLPPTFAQNSRPQGLRPQRPSQSGDVSASSSFNAASQSSAAFQPNEASQTSSSPSAFSDRFNTQSSQQSNGFQKRPQSFNNQFNQNQFAQNQFPSTQEEQNEDSADQSEDSQSGQVSNGSGSFNQPPTSQPSTDLTTPFESSEQSQSNTISSSSASSSGFGAQSPSLRPSSQYGNNKQSPLTSSRPQNQFAGSEAPFSSQGQSQYAQSAFNANQPTTQNGFDQTETEDAQFSPSTARPSFGQTQVQAQGPDSSYYYRQPAKPFSTPSGSRFPGAPPRQFNRVNQQSTQSSAQFSGTFPQSFPVNSFNRGSNRFTGSPTFAPTAPTGSSDGQFQGSTISSEYNGITQASISPFQPQNQGSTKYPRPLTPTAPTLASQYNGITQATASSFTSAPSAPFGSRPTFQQSFKQPQSSQSNKPFAPQPESDDEDSQSQNPEVATQQYNGEIYDYSKPPQGLPAPAQKEPTTAPQRGQNFQTGSQTRPQFSAAQGSNDQEMNSQQPTRPAFGARPQFGTRPSRPQFGGFNTQASVEQPAQDSRPQINGDQRPDQRPFGQSQDRQEPAPSGNRVKCCQSLDAKLESFRGSSQNAASAPSQFGNKFSVSQSSGVGASGQGQFGAQFSGPQATSQSFAGRGEEFGGPRKPPSFDQQTGYHY